MDPEAAAQEIMEVLFSMAGNAGQESILDQAAPGFIDWAADAIAQDEDQPPNEYSMQDSLGIRQELYDATNQIWSEGFRMVMEAWEDALNQFDGDEGGDEGGGGRGGGSEEKARDREKRERGRSGERRSFRENLRTLRESGGGRAGIRSAERSAARAAAGRAVARVAVRVVTRI